MTNRNASVGGGEPSRGSTSPNWVSKKLVALSSAAILSVYAIGYARTQAADQRLTAPDVQPTPTNAVATAVARAASPAQVIQTPSKSSGYRDGTYVGSGSSRHGGIEATVVITGGKIVSTRITQCLTRYSCSWIAQLPGEVVARQSAKVDMVSGATDSSRAFIQAVTNALSHAA